MKPWAKVVLSPSAEECSRHAKPCTVERVDANNFRLKCECGCKATATREHANAHTSVNWERAE